MRKNRRPGYLPLIEPLENRLTPNSAPVISDATFYVDENVAIYSLVDQVIASDADEDALTYAITGGNIDDAFAIDASTGTLSVVGDLDFETISSYTLTVEVSDGSLANSANITVLLNNINEAPTLGGAAYGIDENAAPGALVGQAVAADVDAATTLTYAITSGNYGDVFAIDASTGAITVAGILDFEACSSYTLTVEVSDGSLSSAAEFTVTLNDINEAPTLTVTPLTVDESSGVGAAIGQVSGADVDAGAVLSYAIIAGNVGNVFAINSTTGEITVAGDLDFEALASYTLTVEVSDGSLTDTASVTITVNDSNEAPTLADASFAVAENSSSSTVVGQVVGTDIDAGAALSYAIIAGSSDIFAINAATGEITVIGPIDFEVASSYILTIEVSDGSLTATAEITIIVNNVNEAPTLENAYLNLDENSAAGTFVGQIVGIDPDAGATLSYAIISGNTGAVFAIDSATGEITLVGAVNYEALANYMLVVEVSDGSLSTTANVAVTVNDVNEAPTLGDAAFIVNENSSVGTLVGQVAGADADTGSTLSYSIVAGNVDDVFAIDAATGQITVANGAGLDFETLARYELLIQVADNGSPTMYGTATVTIDLNDVNETPTATLDELPSDVVEGSLVSLGASGSDPDAGAALTYSWVVTFAGASVASGTGATFSFTPSDDGTYEITVTVNDGVLESSDSASLTVGNVAPEFTYTGENSVNEGAAYSLAIDWSDPGNDALVTATVDWGDGQQEVVDVADLDNLTHVYTLPGTYYINFSATDEDGSYTASAAKEIVVVNIDPVLTLSVAYGSGRMITLSGQVQDLHPGGLTVTFSGQAVGSTTTNLDGSYSLTIEATGIGDVTAVVQDIVGAHSNTASVSLNSTKPTITLFATISVTAPGEWRFYGRVCDECCAGLTVTLGGLPGITNAASCTTVTDANGDFSIVFDLGEDVEGTANAFVADWWGITSDLAEFHFV